MKLRDENYVVIKGWMITRLKLKGTQLLLYSLIYGFSQDGESKFCGSLKYLAEFAGVTENSARMNLQQLARKGLIQIKEHTGYCNSYSVILEPKAEEVVEKKPKERTNEVAEIVEYLNEKTGKRYKTTAYETYKPIQARLREGFAVSDFKKVIDIKCSEWLNNEKMEKYLRPQTLFGTKFQSYLNQKPIENQPKSEASYNLDEFKSMAITKKVEYKKRE